MPAATIAFTSAGTQIFIALALPTAHTGTAFAALSWDEIGEVDEIPEFGPEYSIIKRTPLAQRTVRKLKGSVDYGNLMLKAAKVPGDDGHAACLTALDEDDAQSFKVKFADGTISYFTGLVYAYKSSVGGSESFTGAAIGIEIDSKPIEVAPA